MTIKENLPEKETSSNLHYLVEGKYLTDYDEWTHNTEGLIHQSILFPVVYLRTKNRKVLTLKSLSIEYNTLLIVHLIKFQNIF